MALPRPRHDAYGNPVQPLTDARVERLYDRPMNQDVRRAIAEELLVQLERQYDLLLRRGTYAEVCVRFVVRNGVLDEHYHVGIDQRVRRERRDSDGP